MICGPIIPNTTAGLRELIASEPARIERGLRLVAQDLVLGPAAEVDALCCDADGAAVLVFVVESCACATLPLRLLTARSWMVANADWLVAEFDDPGLRADRPPRLVVIAHEILADTLAELHGLALAELSVKQICTFSVEGRPRVGLTELVAPVAAAVAPPVVADPFSVPPGIVQPDDRAVFARFLDLCRRIDPRLTATGDRFSRRLLLDGRVVADIGLVEGRLCLGLAHGGPALAVERDSCLGAVDRVMRAVLAAGAPAPEERPALRRFDLPEPHDPPASRPMASGVNGDPDENTSDAGPDVAPAEPDNPMEQPRTTPRQVLEHDRFSLEPIRRSVARAQLSREEFSALGEDASET